MAELLEIDFERVERLLEYGCKGTEIAAVFGIHPDTLYDRVKLVYGISWSAFSQQMKEKGDTLLREAQFLKAVKDKDTTMQIWLGKTRLKQKEEPVEQSTQHRIIIQDTDELRDVQPEAEDELPRCDGED